MTTRYDRMRAAADELNEAASELWFRAQEYLGKYESLLKPRREDYNRAMEACERLRSDADELEAVEREMRAILIVDKWADRIRGEK